MIYTIKQLFKGPISFIYTQKTIWTNIHNPLFFKITNYKIKQSLTLLNSEFKTHKYLIDQDKNNYLLIKEDKKLSLYINYKTKVKCSLGDIEEMLYLLDIYKERFLF